MALMISSTLLILKSGSDLLNNTLNRFSYETEERNLALLSAIGSIILANSITTIVGL